MSEYSDFEGWLVVVADKLNVSFSEAEAILGDDAHSAYENGASPSEYAQKAIDEFTYGTFNVD
jgi:hypothetical protein